MKYLLIFWLANSSLAEHMTDGSPHGPLINGPASIAPFDTLEACQFARANIFWSAQQADAMAFAVCTPKGGTSKELQKEWEAMNYRCLHPAKEENGCPEVLFTPKPQ